MPATSVTPDQDDVTTLLRSFLLDILPSGTEVILAQPNRVPEPSIDNFVVMTPVHIKRLATNFDESGDVKFQGTITDALMDVTFFSPNSKGKIEIGSPVFGVDVAAGTKVTALGTGTGETGTYTVSPVAQNISEEVLSAGRWSATQPSQWTIQLDFHSKDTVSADMAQAVSTLFRDEYATRFFTSINAAITPLYADDPKQAPFINDQMQYEWRWIVEAVIQVNQKILTPQQYADKVNVRLIEIDEHFPP